MRPVLGIDLFGSHLHLAAYGLFLTLAAGLAISLGWAIATRRGLPAGRTGACTFGAAMAAIAGARLLDGATKGNSYSADPLALVRVDFTGFSLYGGLLLALPVGYLLCRLLAVDPFVLADALAPAIGLGIAVSKLGCFFAGCCFGAPAALPWGVSFPVGSEAHLHQLFTGAVAPGRAPLPVHPTQLYEAAAAVAGSIGALWLLSRHAPRGTTFLGFVLWFTAFRLAAEQLRAPSLSLSVPPWFYPALYSAILLLAGAILARRLLQERGRPRPSPARS